MCSQPVRGIYLAMLAIDCLCSLSPPLATPLCNATNKSSKPIFLWLIPTNTCFRPPKEGGGGLEGAFQRSTFARYTLYSRYRIGGGTSGKSVIDGSTETRPRGTSFRLPAELAAVTLRKCDRAAASTVGSHIFQWAAIATPPVACGRRFA